MKYISTRGETAHKKFTEVLLMGLAPDGGLMMPEEYPQIDEQTLAQWRELSYADLAFEIMSLFVDDIPAQDLRSIVNKTYTQDVFGSADITPVRTLSDGLKVQALSNGPTLAFKDMAMQFLGNVFEYVLKRDNKQLNILGATSGDTGSAAEYAMRGKDNINVFMLSPLGKMSAFQRAQMYSLTDKNIFNIAVEGVFDDCQDIVKAAQADAHFKHEQNIGTVNSINWARVVAQVVYYFQGYFLATHTNEEKVSFCVPSGNFGNVCAGHVARKMGLPIHRLIVATNENDVLDEFFHTGAYRPRTPENTVITSSPSMDISKASNFERFIFDLVDRDADQVKALWAEVGAGIGFDLHFMLETIQHRYGFVSGKSTHADRLNTIRDVYLAGDGFVDPHTADGIKVAREVREVGEKIVCLETALATKFDVIVHEALGADVQIPRPENLNDLESRTQYVTELANNVDVIKVFIKEKLAQ